MNTTLHDIVMIGAVGTSVIGGGSLFIDKTLVETGVIAALKREHLQPSDFYCSQTNRMTISARSDECHDMGKDAALSLLLMGAGLAGVPAYTRARREEEKEQG